MSKSNTSAGNGGFNSFIGWGVTSLLLFLFNRRKGGGNTSSAQPSKYTADNTNSIGSPIPVALGRVMIKNPLVSYYGDFGSEPYTEEYGMHSKLSVRDVLLQMLILALTIAFLPREHVVITNTGGGKAIDIANGRDNKLIMMAIMNFLLWLLMALFNRHAGRTTIQKGFKYYLGWQNILCWTGKNIGLKKVWMDVYDSGVQSSTEQGVWDNNSSVAWKADNQTGIIAHIDKPDLFGGVDEGGGFVGDIRVYFGTESQNFDSWMVKEMQQPSIPNELKGLTPLYPKFMTAVVPRAYIGKQASIPEMWFEVLNYPTRLSDEHQDRIRQKFDNAISEYLPDIISYIESQDKTVGDFIRVEYTEFKKARDKYQKAHKKLVENTDTIQMLKNRIEYLSGVDDEDAQKSCEDLRRELATLETQRPLLESEVNTAFEGLKEKLNALIEKYPPTNRDELKNIAKPLLDLVEKGQWKLGRLGDDANPAEVIYEILKNDLWGANYPDRKIDIDSLITIGGRCEEDKMGISCLFNQTATTGEYITKILDHINGIMFVSAVTGKLTFRLIRSDYDPDKIPVFDMDNCESLTYTRLDWGETSSASSVNFTMADDVSKYEQGTVTVYDEANVRITKNQVENSYDGTYFTTADNAKIMAQTKMLSAGYPLASIEIVCNRRGYDLVIGDVIKVTWTPYGIKEQVFRINDINYGTLTDGKIKITAIEDVFGFDSTKYEYSEIPSWDQEDHPAVSIVRYRYEEMPFEITRSLDTFIHAYAAQPSEHCMGWYIWRRVFGNYDKSSNSTKFSMVGRVMYGFPEDYANLDDGIEIKPIGTNAETDFSNYIKEAERDPYRYNNKSGLNLLIVDNEIISFEKITRLPNGNYNLSKVIRGVYDTLPAVHTAESICFFLNTGLSISGSDPATRNGEAATESLELTTYTVSEAEPFSYSKTEGFVSRRRSESPSIMANLRFCPDRGELTTMAYNYPSGTVFTHDMLFEFYGRNKFTNPQIIEHKDTTEYLVDENVQNVITVKSNDVEFNIVADGKYRENGVEKNTQNMTLKWEDFCKNMDRKLKDHNDVTLEINTHDKTRNLDSYYSYEKHIIYAVPRIMCIVSTEEDVKQAIEKIGRETTVVTRDINGVDITVTYNYSPLVFVGEERTIGVLAQDGKRYVLTDTVYKLDGYKDNKVLYHKIDLGKDFVVRCDFGGKSKYYKRVTLQNWTEVEVGV